MRAASRARAAVRHFSMIRRPSAGFSSRYWPRLSATAVWTWPLTSALPSLALVWPSNCGSVSLTLMTAVRPSRTSSPDRLPSASRRTPARRAQSLSELVSAARKPVTWRAAVGRVDVVGEGEDVLGVRVVVLEGDLDGRAALAPLDVDRPGVEDFLVPVQVPDERLEAALEVERALAIVPLVDERDPDALRQVGGLAQALADQLERVLGRLEHLGIGEEARRRAATGALRADLLDRARRLAARVLLRPDEPVARRFDAHPRRQRVDDADADAVQAARHLVAAAAELAAGMEDGMDDLERVLAGGVLADRHAAAVVLDDDDAVRLDRDRGSSVAWPAIASSIELSTTSQTRWCRPRSSVEPMYMPGRFRTASRPSRTWMLAAS